MWRVRALDLALETSTENLKAPILTCHPSPRNSLECQPSLQNVIKQIVIYIVSGSQGREKYVDLSLSLMKTIRIHLLSITN